MLWPQLILCSAFVYKFSRSFSSFFSLPDLAKRGFAGISRNYYVWLPFCGVPDQNGIQLASYPWANIASFNPSKQHRVF